MSFAFCVNVMFVPAVKDLNYKSTPVFCLKTPAPLPTLLAVFTSPDPTEDTVIVSIPGVIIMFAPDTIFLN